MNPFAAPAAAPKPSSAKRAPRQRVALSPVPTLFPPGDFPTLPGTLARVVVPYPSPALSPNARGHWSKKSRAAKAYRRECWVLALEAFGSGTLRLADAGPIRVHIDFFPPDQQARDDDNAIASFKAGRDGIADALKADDSRFVTSHLFHRTCAPAQRGCVVVSLLASGAA